MTDKLPLSHYSSQWLDWPKCNRYALASAGYCTSPWSPQRRTVTLQLRWSGTQWQLLTLSNAEDWRTLSQPVDELCIDPQRQCFWRCQAGQVPLTEQPRVLSSFLSDRQRTCIHHSYHVESDPIPDQETEDD
ncbi:hypothetical protein [Aeromonas caviae]